MAGIKLNRATGSVSTYEVGALVVDIYDAKAKQLAWRGEALACPNQ
jgi:hypothetical protein